MYDRRGCPRIRIRNASVSPGAPRASWWGLDCTYDSHRPIRAPLVSLSYSGGIWRCLASDELLIQGEWGWLPVRVAADKKTKGEVAIQSRRGNPIKKGAQPDDLAIPSLAPRQRCREEPIGTPSRREERQARDEAKRR